MPRRTLRLHFCCDIIPKGQGYGTLQNKRSFPDPKLTMVDRMDLFDLGTYFASCVPVRARSNPLLKYAACAYAAKQLGRVKGVKAKMGGVCSRQAIMEVWSDQDTDFAWLGAKYYEKAIQLLMKELQPDAEAPPPLGPPDAFGQWQANELSDDAENPRKRRRRVSNSRLSRGVHSDEILAATAILSVYEFLDATGPAWSRHLSGVKSLLDVAEVGIMPSDHHSSDGDSPYQYKKSRLSRARKAAFWNFARQDYLAACEFTIFWLNLFLRILLTLSSHQRMPHKAEHRRHRTVDPSRVATRPNGLCATQQYG